MELKEAIARRRTANNAFSTEPLKEEHIREIIYAANRAPSHFNSQPWDFILVTDSEVRNRIGQIAKDSMRQLMQEGTFFKRYLKYFRFSKEEIDKKRTGIYIDRIPGILKPFVSMIFGESGVKFLNFFKVPEILSKDAEKIVAEAPLLIGFMLRKDEYQAGEKSGIYSLISMGAALQNMWLTATSLGIGLQFVSTPMEIPANWNKVLEVLKVPATHELMAVYRLGYLNPEGKRNEIDWISDERRSFENLVSWNYYQKKDSEV